VIADVAVVAGLSLPWLGYYAWYCRAVLSGRWD
jgi:hypothetical protein